MNLIAYVAYEEYGCEKVKTAFAMAMQALKETRMERRLQHIVKQACRLSSWDSWRAIGVVQARVGRI